MRILHIILPYLVIILGGAFLIAGILLDNGIEKSILLGLGVGIYNAIILILYERTRGEKL